MKVIYHQYLPIPKTKQNHHYWVMHYLKNFGTGYKKADLEKTYTKTIPDPANKDQRKNGRIFVIPDIVLDNKYVVEVSLGGVTINSSMNSNKLKAFGLELKEVFVVHFVPGFLREKYRIEIDDSGKPYPQFQQPSYKEFEIK